MGVVKGSATQICLNLNIIFKKFFLSLFLIAFFGSFLSVS